MKKRIAILGSTGSVGQTVLSVVRRFGDRFDVVYLGCRKNTERLLEQIYEFKPFAVGIEDEERAEELKKRVKNLKVFSGDATEEGFLEIESDLIVMSVSGISGLKPTFNALKEGRTVALSNKEAVVSGGRFIKPFLDRIIPVDSEHSALFQLLRNVRRDEVKKIFITASGGPFLNGKPEKVEISDVLNHPVWRMGGKITVDSATMMNKALEVIEAHYLFGFSPDEIKVLIHPQSLMHGVLGLKDGSMISYMSYPNMVFPVSYALFYPERAPLKVYDYDIYSFKELNFMEPDRERFPLLFLAYRALEEGKEIVLNVSDEVAAQYFLSGKISFSDIERVIFYVYETFDFEQPESFDKIIDIHKKAETFTKSYIEEVIL